MLAVQSARDDLDAVEQREHESELSSYRSDTARQSVVLGMVIGVLLGLAGVQILGTLYDVTYLEGTQKYLFKAMDILLTASLIAGGSNGVNQVTSLMNKQLSARNPDNTI